MFLHRTASIRLGPERCSACLNSVIRVSTLSTRTEGTPKPTARSAQRTAGDVRSVNDAYALVACERLVEGAVAVLLPPNGA